MGSYKLEYTIIPEKPNPVSNFASSPPYYWDDAEIEFLANEKALQGYRIQLRYLETNINDEGQMITEYKGFSLLNQTLKEELPAFYTKGFSNLFTASPGIYVAGRPAIAGITDGAAYSYTLIFNESSLLYVPRLSTLTQPAVESITNNVEDGVNIPLEPYAPDADPPQFPMDIIQNFKLDKRREVIIPFTLRTTIKPMSDRGQITDTIKIYHPVVQDMKKMPGKLKSLNEKCYFYNKYVHTGLYPINTPDNYNDKGELIGQLNEPVKTSDLTRKVYKLDGDT